MKVKEKIVRLCLISLFQIFSTVALATAEKSKSFDWQPIINAIIEVESNGNVNAKKGNSVGAMQITPILVAECNNILKERKIKKRYVLSDRYNLVKSKEMFLLMQSKFNPNNNVEKAIRAWNGGNKYSVKRTQRYYEKVMKALQAKK